MKLSAYLFSFLLVGFSSLFSQGIETYLISVPINNDNLNNKIECLELPVVYIDEDQLITVVSSERINDIKADGIEYTELNKISSSDKFFLFSSKKDQDISSKIRGELIVYKGNDFVITKNTTLKPEETAKIGLKVIELKAKSNFENVKRIWNNDELFLSDSTIAMITSSVNPDSVQVFHSNSSKFSNKISICKHTRRGCSVDKKSIFTNGFCRRCNRFISIPGNMAKKCDCYANGNL